MKKTKFIVIISILLCLSIVIPHSFAIDDAFNETLSDMDSDVLSDDYYFDSNSANDGNGLADNPYNNLTNDRIKSNSVIHLANGEYNLSGDSYCSDVSFYGENAQNTILNGNGYTLHGSGSLTFKDITLINIKIETANSLMVFNTIFKHCGDGNSNGGAIYSSSSGSITLTNCSFYNNSALYGGAVYMGDGSIDTTDMKKGSIEIFNSTFENNSALYGGAIYVDRNWLEIYNSAFKNNVALMSGGAITSILGEYFIDYSSFSNNKAGFEGGAVYSYWGSSSIFNSTFTNNSANAGGALFIDVNDTDNDNDNVNVSGNKFKYNVAKKAGAVYSLSNYDSTIINNTYVDNSAISDNDLLQTDNPYLFVGNGNYTIYTYNSSFTGKLPSYYNLKDDGYVTPVKNQGNGGNCWTFASLAALESCILKAYGISYDLSEDNMKNLMSRYSDYGWDMEPNYGGYDKMAVGYLVGWLGPVFESQDPYDSKSIFSLIFNSFTHIQNIAFITRANYTDNDAIKKAILDYGAVATSAYWGGPKKGNSRYYNGSAGANHAVAIVGWDDNYSRNNFALTPPGDGAWIVKNSHGTGSGDKGYWYVSYYDVRLAQPGKKGSTYTFIFNDTLKFDKNYQYDLSGKTDFFLNTSSTVWYKNIFNATDNEYLAAVSTYFYGDANYTFSILVNDVLKLTQSGFSKEGYYTFELNELIPLEVGDVFEIIFKVTVDGESGVPISEKISLNKCSYTENISFISYDGENWTDLFNLSWKYPDHTYDSQVACIKAFTILNQINASLSLTIENRSQNSADIVAHVVNQWGYPVNMGNVTFMFGDEEYTVKLVNGIARITVNFKSANLTVNFNQVGYCQLNSSIEIRNPLINTTITLNITGEHNPVNIVANIVDENNLPVKRGFVNFIIEDKIYPAKVSNGIAKLENIKVTPSKLNISAYYTELFYYGSSNVNESTEISLINTKISLNMPSGESYNPVVISVNVFDEFDAPVSGGNVTFNLDGEIFTLDLTEGFVSFSRVLSIGSHNISARYNGVEYYYFNSSNTYREFNASLMDTNIKLTIDNEYNPISITAVITDQYGNGINKGYATFIVDKKSYSVNVNKGIAKLDYSFKNFGLNDIYVFYGFDDYYNSSEASANVDVKSTILSGDATKTYNSKYSFTLLDNYGNPLKKTTVLVTIGSQMYYSTTNEKGVAIVDIALNPGFYSVKITNPKNNEVKTQTINVVKRITENNAVTMYYGAGKYYKVKVFDDNGNIAKGVSVSFKINGKSYTRNTDSNGYASFKISLNPGKYTISAEYKGYNVSNKITVKTTLITKNIIVKKGKTIKFTAKLLNINGKILKNKKITFKFKGKTYKVKTNKKGIATLKIYKKYKVGKYTITTKYGKLSQRNTIKIKK